MKLFYKIRCWDILYFGFSVLTLVGCNSLEEEFIQDTAHEFVVDSDYLIDKAPISLSTTDVFKVSRNFYIHNHQSTRLSSSVFSDETITPVLSSKGDALMYIISYGKSNGYTIVSATKEYSPIIAFSENGTWESSNEVLSYFVEEYKQKIESQEFLDSDSLRSVHAFEWLSYEKPDVNMTRLIHPTDQMIEEWKSTARANLISQGYSVYDFSQALMQIPPTVDTPNRAERFVQELCDHTFPGYDCMDVNLFAKRTTQNVTGPLLQTEWHQLSPYCGHAPNGIAGCLTIAMAQVMKYHEWPSYYDWNRIINHYYEWASETDYNIIALNHLIDSLLTSCSPNYHSNGTDIVPARAVSVLRDNGYTVSQHLYNGINDNGRIIQSIENGYPVIMLGYSSSTGEGHAWVCDGIKENRTQYAAMYLDELGDYFFHEGISDSSSFLHMNLGFQNNPSIWLYNDAISISNFTYSNNRMYYLVTPNR